MNQQETHQKVEGQLSGVPIELKKNFAKLKLKTTNNMIVDETGLVHGGFIFSLADYCAMLTINHPNVVLGKAEVRFLKPVVLNDLLIADGTVIRTNGKKSEVKVKVHRNDDLVFEGIFTCFTPEVHILKKGDL
jgi:acyl-coenzyme A thioesterase PaaI-like protein